MHPSLRGYAVAVLQTSAADGSTAGVASELAQVGRLVAGNQNLSRALTDVGVPVAARRAVLTDLLERQVRPAALQLVVRIVETVRAPELLTAVHEVAELARAGAERVDGEEPAGAEPALGLSATRQMLAGYAAAVLEAAGTAELESVEDELFRLARVVESHQPLRRALSDRTVPVDRRRMVIDDLIGAQAHPATLRLAGRAVASRTRDVVGNLDWLVEQAAAARGWRLARVHAAQAVEGDDRRHLADALAYLTGRPVELQVSIDAELLGGAVIEVGDLVIDASARHRLDQLHDVLLGAEGATRGVST